MHRTVVIFLAITIGNVAFAASSDSITSVQNAFECKQRLADTPAIRSALGNKEKSELRETGLSGNYTLSQPIKVFGYELHNVHISEDADTGTSYSITLPKSELKKLAQTAKLKANDGSYYRAFKGGHIEAGNSAPGSIALSCIWAN
ncbi:hypothetical protein HQN60_15725 (plasmid) [Deefgea piscis]|uniref:Uncharacterized protein n=1 Tax=Deefgea piscis TaxID=2739061 RepID=A0A6M8SYS0_9NEIS|nr:hypothetical protein [Deefgea piscis]QKJ68260.1 hypothetical protein HQN60_15725 [Deefgea piscis]